MDLLISSVAHNPGLPTRYHADEAPIWPRFATEDPIGGLTTATGTKRAARDRLAGHVGNMILALEITVRPDHQRSGLPEDPWLRVHVRAGGRIVSICHRAMVVPGTLAVWREWTGLPFDRSGDVIVPSALVPVQCDVAHDHDVYVEPAAWVCQKLAR